MSPKHSIFPIKETQYETIRALMTCCFSNSETRSGNVCFFMRADIKQQTARNFQEVYFPGLHKADRGFMYKNLVMAPLRIIIFALSCHNL